MRKVILNLCTSLDGYIEGSNGEIDWCLTDQDYAMTPFLERIDTLFLGRISYEQLERDFPQGFAGKQKIVFSTTLNPSTTKHRVISGDMVQAVETIKQEEGKDIWLFGGASLLKSFLEHGLVDELMIAIHPLLLGSGKALLKDLTKRVELELTNTITYNTDLVQLFYKVK